MEVEHVAGYWEHDMGHCEKHKEDYYYAQEAEVDYVGQGSICHSRGGSGLFVRDCRPLVGKEKVHNCFL